jgi:hypothetical protein
VGKMQSTFNVNAGGKHSYHCALKSEIVHTNRAITIMPLDYKSFRSEWTSCDSYQVTANTYKLE